MTDYEQARRAMVDNQLRTNSITDRRILRAMGEVPREIFLPEARRALAYIDDTHLLPGGSGRAIAAPAPFARLLQLAGVEPTDTVLDVGGGTGYSTAVIAQLAGSVVLVDSDENMLDAAQQILAGLGARNVTIVVGEPLRGAPKHGPFDVIMIEGAVEEVPGALLRQLKQGGRLVALVRAGAASVAKVFVRFGDDFAPRTEFNTTLPPLVSTRAPEAFVF